GELLLSVFHVLCSAHAEDRRLNQPVPLEHQTRGWLSDGAPSAAPRKVVRNRRFHKSGRPGSNRRRPAWEAFLALVGQGFFGGGSRNGITQYSWFSSDWRFRQMRMDGPRCRQGQRTM